MANSPLPNELLIIMNDNQKIAVNAISQFVNCADEEEILLASLQIAKAFKKEEAFNMLKEENASEAEKLLIESFMSNIKLLVQKTWVEKKDEQNKEIVLNRIHSLCNTLVGSNYDNIYKDSFAECFLILHNVVLLLFGDLAASDSFIEYAFRIDPDFGFFWYYVTNISELKIMSNQKAKYAIFLAMFFLANF